jgi:hypothetical protein
MLGSKIRIDTAFKFLPTLDDWLYKPECRSLVQSIKFFILFSKFVFCKFPTQFYTYLDQPSGSTDAAEIGTRGRKNL